MTNFFDFEYELESRVLGDIDFHSDHPDNYESFFDFTLDEVKNRYVEFLNLTSDSIEEVDRNNNQQDQDNINQQSGQSDSDNLKERQTDMEIGSNLNHEIEELKGSSIETAFQDFNYWKPQVDHNLDDLLDEMNSN